MVHGSAPVAGGGWHVGKAQCPRVTLEARFSTSATMEFLNKVAAVSGRLVTSVMLASPSSHMACTTGSALGEPTTPRQLSGGDRVSPGSAHSSSVLGRSWSPFYDNLASAHRAGGDAKEAGHLIAHGLAPVGREVGARAEPCRALPAWHCPEDDEAAPGSKPISGRAGHVQP